MTRACILEAIGTGPLAELCIILGIEVIDVCRGTMGAVNYDLHGRLSGGLVKRYSSERGQTSLVWALVRPPGDRWNLVTSVDLRRENSLNEHALIWGRSPSLPRLTSEDGRRILRLMHEHIEQSEGTS